MRPIFHRMTSYLSECQFPKLQNEDERLQMESRSLMISVQIQCLFPCPTITWQPHLQGQVGMLLFLANLQAGQVGILELKVIFLLEILCHCALHSLSTLQLQGKPVWRKERRCQELRTDSHLSRPTTMKAPDLALSLSSLFRVLPLLGKQAIQGSKTEVKDLSGKFHNQQDLTLFICISNVGHKA